MPYRTPAIPPSFALDRAPPCRHARRTAFAVPLGLSLVLALAVVAGELADRPAAPRVALRPRVVPVTALAWPPGCNPEWGCRVDIAGSRFAGRGVELRFTTPDG